MILDMVLLLLSVSQVRENMGKEHKVKKCLGGKKTLFKHRSSCSEMD